MEEGKWTHVPPTVPGWYWVMEDGFLFITEAFELNGDLWFDAGEDNGVLSSDIDWLDWWTVPITEPPQED